VGHGLLQQMLHTKGDGSCSMLQLLQTVAGGSWSAAAIVADYKRWVMVSCSSCCGLHEVGHGQVQQFLWERMVGHGQLQQLL
jgi:hypothetical protein